MKQMERGAEDEEAGEGEKERGEQGSKVKQREIGVMAEDEEKKAEAREVEKESAVTVRMTMHFCISCCTTKHGTARKRRRWRTSRWTLPGGH